MAKGLSPLQHAILRALAGRPSLHEIGELADDLPDDVLSFKAREPRVARNSLRRALHRLWERGLILRTAQPRKNPDTGRVAFAWGLATEEVRARNSCADADFVVSPACSLHQPHGPRVLPDPICTQGERVGTEAYPIMASIAANEQTISAMSDDDDADGGTPLSYNVFLLTQQDGAASPAEIGPGATPQAREVKRAIRAWCDTKERRAALRAFNGMKIRKLASKLSFGGEEARRQFPYLVLNWADHWFMKKKRPLARLSSKDAKALREISLLSDKLFWKLYHLSPTAKEMLCRGLLVSHLDPADLGKVPPDLLHRYWPPSRLHHAREEVKVLAHAARPLRDIRGKPGQQSHYPEALADIADIYKRVTGKPPTRTWNNYTEKREGQFRMLAQGMMEAVWPDCGSLDGLIEDLCTKSRQKHRE
jgi:hypothetical protein